MFEKLRMLRRKKKIKALRMAEVLGLKTEGAYYKKEAGIAPITLQEAKLIATELGLPLWEVFDENEIILRRK